MNLGVSDAKLIDSGLVPVDDRFPDYCRAPGCPGFNQSMSCPPNVPGPTWFRQNLKKVDQVLVFKFEIPFDVLLSSERHDITRLLHETAADIERFARQVGFNHSKGYAGGSCKQLFCENHLDCRVLSGRGECRNHDRARPSMSGMGVDFLELCKTVGWKTHNGQDNDQNGVSIGVMAGMVLIQNVD